jgi:hypothetical protein
MHEILTSSKFSGSNNVRNGIKGQVSDPVTRRKHRRMNHVVFCTWKRIQRSKPVINKHQHHSYRKEVKNSTQNIHPLHWSTCRFHKMECHFWLVLFTKWNSDLKISTQDTFQDYTSFWLNWYGVILDMGTWNLYAVTFQCRTFQCISNICI